MDSSQLDQLKGELKNLIASNNIDQAIQRLKSIVPPSSIRYNFLIKFQQEYASISESKWKDIYSPAELNVKQAKLVDNLLEFVDILEESDFSSSSGTNRRRHRTGSVLYAIPSQMEIGREQKCVIRLAFDENMLREYFASDNDTHIETLRRIEEQMEVELIDPNEEDIFSIRTINSKRQIVEQDDYTEWLYYVKPHQEGVFELYLKVTVIIADKGKKEIVLHEKVEVTTHVAEEVGAGAGFKDTGLLFALAIPAAPPLGHEAPAEPTASAAPSKGIWKSLGAKIGAAVGGAALVGGLMLYGPATSPSSEIQETTGQAMFVKQEVAAPIPEIGDLYELFEIDPKRDTTLETQSGTLVHVPAYSIVDQQGELVTEKVSIRIQEIRKTHEIIASGIPMRYYDEAGGESWMQTSGMFEVTGFLRGEKVQIAQGKTVTVSFTTETSEAIDFWFFDEASGNWESRDRNTTATDNPNLRSFTDEPSSAPPPPSLQPVLGDPKKILPPLKIDYRYFPELKKFRNLEWEYTGPPENNPRNDPSFFDNWDQLVINEGNNNTYQLTFIRGERRLNVPVRPCFRRAKDLQAFEQGMTNYRQQQQEYEAYMERERERETYRERQYRFVRQVGIQEFGIYNWDYLIKIDDALRLSADFDFAGQLPEDLEEEVLVYLITGGGRTVVSFPKSSWRFFSFIPDMDNQLLAVLPGGRVAVFTQEQFESEISNLQNARNETYRFKMKVLPDRIDDIKDLEQVTG